MKPWKEMSPVEKVAALQPLFARGLTYREIAAIVGSSSGAVAGFVHTHPEAKAPTFLLFGDGVASARIAVRLKSMKAPPPAGPAGTDGDRPTPATETRGGTGDDCSVGKRGEWPPQGGASSSRELNDIVSEQVVTAGETATISALTEAKRYRSWASMKHAERIAAVRELTADGKMSRIAMAEALDTTMATLDGWRNEHRQVLNADPAVKPSSEIQSVARTVVNTSMLGSTGPATKTVSLPLVRSIATPVEPQPAEAPLSSMDPSYRSFTAALFGDPPIGRSALDQRQPSGGRTE